MYTVFFISATKLKFENRYSSSVRAFSYNKQLVVCLKILKLKLNCSTGCILKS